MLKAAVSIGAVLVSGTTILATTTHSTGSAVESTGVANTAENEVSGQQSEATLWGIYGHHNLHDCPINNKQTAEYVVEASKADLTPLFQKYGITALRDRYHSGLEHTFMWVFETTRPHDLEEFAIELGIASWNDLTFVPVRTFEDGVAPVVAKIHGIDY